MLQSRTPMYLRDVHMTQISQDPEGKSRAKKANACAIALVLEPFLVDQAGTVGEKLVATLFDEGIARAEAKALSWVMEAGPKDVYRMEFRGGPDVKAAACTIAGVQVDSVLKVSRDKDASVFKATLTAKFEADRQQLAYLATNYTGQLFVTIELEQPSLTDVEP